jgi:hypothetical protein
MTPTPNPTIADLARACAEAITADGAGIGDPSSPLGGRLRALLEALMNADPRLIFDRAGRPAAVAAVREALPQLEQELFDAVLEDCSCELAATHEALLEIVRSLKS